MAQLFQTQEQVQQEQQNWGSLVQQKQQSLYGEEEQRRRSFSAGLGNSMLASSLNEVGRWMDYDTDSTFNAQTELLKEETQRIQLGMGMFNPEEREALLSSRSMADYANRKGYLQEVQQRNAEIQANPVWGIAGAVMGDAPLAIIGIGAGSVAGSLARSVGAGVKTAQAVSISADAGAALGESALAAYAMQQGNPNVTAADLGFAAIGVAGAALHGVRTVTKNGRTFMKSSEDAPAVRSAGDAGDYRNPVTPETKLDDTVTVRPGEKHVSTTKMDLPEGETIVRVSSDAGSGRTVLRTAADGSVFIDAIPGIAARGMVAHTVNDLLKAVPSEAIIQARTLLKALKTPETFSELRNDVLALLPAQEGVRLAKYFESDTGFLMALQDPSFARTVQQMDVHGKDYLEPVIAYHAKADAVPNMRSEQLADLNMDAEINAGRNALADKKLQKNFVEKILGLGNSFLGKHASLWDRVAYTGDKARTLSNRLFSNASASGARIDSASDLKRTMELQYAAEAHAVNDALEKLVRAEGIKATDRFTNNAKFSAALYKHADNVSRFMQTQYQLERRGEVLQAIPAEYQEVVQTIQQWSKSRREMMQKHGLEVPEGFSDWYLPVRYDFAETQGVLAAKGITSDDAIASLMRQALEDAYPTMSKADITRAATAFQDRVLGTGLQQKRTLQELMEETGDELQDSISAYVKSSDGEVPALTQNLRRRTGINTDTKYIVDGKELSFQDLMQKDFIASIRSYDQHMMGKMALRDAGFDSHSALSKAVAEAEAEVPIKDRAKWKQAIDDGVQRILSTDSNPTPMFMQIVSKFASATMLRNSGAYQAVDSGFIHMTFGAKNIQKAMQKETKQLLEGMKDKQVFSQLDAVLGGAHLNDTKAAYINRKIEQTLNITNGERILGVANNVASATQTWNGMRIVQKTQQGAMGAIMRLQLHNLLKAEGKDLASARKVYQEIGGLTDAEMDAIRTAGDSALSVKMQQRLNNAHSRILDTVVQQNRTGEVPHWAEWTNAGQILVGFAKFSLVAFNKVLRRLSQERGVLNGIAAATLYTMPWMIAAQSLMAMRDGKFFDKEGNPQWGDVLAKSASTLTVWGPGTSLVDALFGTGKVNIGNPGIDWGLSALAAPGKIASLDERAGSAIGKVIPMLGMIPGSTYAMDTWFSAAAEQRDALLEEVTE